MCLCVRIAPAEPLASCSWTPRACTIHDRYRGRFFNKQLCHSCAVTLVFTLPLYVSPVVVVVVGFELNGAEQTTETVTTANFIVLSLWCYLTSGQPKGCGHQRVLVVAAAFIAPNPQFTGRSLTLFGFDCCVSVFEGEKNRATAATLSCVVLILVAIVDENCDFCSSREASRPWTSKCCRCSRSSPTTRWLV